MSERDDDYPTGCLIIFITSALVAMIIAVTL
jgi:hypothetical protein